MNTHQRLVVGLPLDALWNEAGPMDAYRRRELGVADIRVMLRAAAVRFVVADCGLPLLWVALADCYDFWKREVQPHLYEEAKPYLDDYPERYFYFVSEWLIDDDEQAIVLEKHH